MVEVRRIFTHLYLFYIYTSHRFTPPTDLHLPQTYTSHRSTPHILQHSNHNMARQNPNIIVTGTPGVGKTTHAEQLARSTGLKHVSVNQIVKDEGFHEGKDEETGSWIVDEDKVRRADSIQPNSAFNQF